MFPKATIDHDSLEISLCKTLFYDFLIASLLKLKEESQTSTKNTFITFNYDNLLEKTLEDRLNLKRDKDYTTDSDIMNKDSNIIPIIKLHGSIDWIKDGNKIKIKQKSDPNDKERIIIPPTFKKVGQSQKL
ncbi:SIR2 family protein [Desulfurella sp.]|uniref:SIR2 family protein n=1 Tax=Desulfurella sp. TaxID=1962857 RepID=UPI0025C48157|nr:SIR2 family protein [Desulfurella sp.]